MKKYLFEKTTLNYYFYYNRYTYRVQYNITKQLQLKKLIYLLVINFDVPMLYFCQLEIVSKITVVDYLVGIYNRIN